MSIIVVVHAPFCTELEPPKLTTLCLQRLGQFRGSATAICLGSRPATKPYETSFTTQILYFIRTNRQKI